MKHNDNKVQTVEFLCDELQIPKNSESYNNFMRMATDNNDDADILIEILETLYKDKKSLCSFYSFNHSLVDALAGLSINKVQLRDVQKAFEYLQGLGYPPDQSRYAKLYRLIIEESHTSD